MLDFYESPLPSGVGKSDTANVTGALFVCYDITDESAGEPAVEMQLDNGQRFPCIPGLLIRLPFARITFYNLATTARTVHFWVGQAGVDYNFTHWQRPVRTLLRGYQDNIGAGSLELFPGTYLGFRRKFFYIQNNHATNALTLRGNPNNATYPQGLVFPRQPPLVLETDAEIVVCNDSAAAIATYVTEVFHVGP